MHRHPRQARTLFCSSVAILLATSLSSGLPAAPDDQLPTLNLPDPKIAEVYRANWLHTLGPCTEGLEPADPRSPHSEARRPWKVDVGGHYPGWYPGVDVKHQAAAYLACGRDLPRVLRAWDLTSRHYRMDDGGIKPSTMRNNPQGIWPEATTGNVHVYYPLRMVATIDFLLLGDIIFRYSRDRDWLRTQLPAMRAARDFIAGWVDADGLLLSYSYDLDQVYREIDGVAQASACLALKRLAGLERLATNEGEAAKARRLAARLEKASNLFFWDAERGYYTEHLAYNNIARRSRLGRILDVSSERRPKFSAANALDGVIGIGVDAFGVGIGAAGDHEWAADGETAGAWVRVGLKRPTTVSRAILVNRTAFGVQAGERFARGYLEFSDGSPRVEVTFSSFAISRAFVSFAPRTVSWVRFVGTGMQGKGGVHAGLAEFQLIAAEEPHLRFNHGMTDTSLAMVAFGVADDARASVVWSYFRDHEASFYEVNGVSAPTWIAERADSYRPHELNKRAPYKDCVAMARIWRYDALMRRRMQDGDGIVQTMGYAHGLSDRPSGGGVGWFAERYGLGRFQPGDEAQATIAKYAGYPAIYNSFIVQEALLGLRADVDGMIHISPCVPETWYQRGFGQEGCGVLHEHRIGFSYRYDRVEGSLSGPQGPRTLAVDLPPGLRAQDASLLVDKVDSEVKIQGRRAIFTVRLSNARRHGFTLRSRARRD